MFHKIIFYVGVFIRNKELFKHFRALKRSEKWTREQLEVHQLAQLRKLLILAGEESMFYRNRFKELDFDPRTVQSLNELVRLPIMTKQDLLDHAVAIQVSSRSDFKAETSGSTGTPFLFYKNKEWDASQRAAIFRGYSWYGVKPWHKNGYFWGFNKTWKQRQKTRILDFLQNRFRLFSYDVEEVKAFLKKMRHAKYLEGYSSMIHQVAVEALNNDLEINDRLLMVKGTSEKIYDAYHDAVRKVFGRKVISEYGAAEAGVIAFECPEGKMHIVSENVIVECIENEIVLTNLYSYSFPIIRYRIGDYIKLAENQAVCVCGMQHPVITEIQGRVGKSIYGFSQKYPSLTLYYVSKNIALEHNLFIEYQAVQEKKGYLEYFIFAPLTDSELSLISEEFEKYYGEDLSVEIKYMGRDQGRSGKMKDFISKVEC